MNSHVSEVEFGFNHVQYTSSETNFEIPVTIRKTESRLARPVSLRVQPLTIADALLMGLSIPLVEGVDKAINIIQDPIRYLVPVRAKGMHIIIAQQSLSIVTMCLN